MKKYLLIILILLALGGIAYAQSTATPIQLGFLSTSGVWAPYSISNPLPVSVQ